MAEPNVSPWIYLASYGVAPNNDLLAYFVGQYGRDATDAQANTFVNWHFTNFGINESRRVFFNRTSYKSNYQDLVNYFGSADETSYAKHFVLDGYWEGRTYTPMSNAPLITITPGGCSGSFSSYTPNAVGYTPLWGCCYKRC